VWKDFEAKALNDTAKDWIARGDDINEPWVFLIGADGKIAARWDNVATRVEIEPLLQKLPVIAG
jgi:peroxiredoxin